MAMNLEALQESLRRAETARRSGAQLVFSDPKSGGVLCKTNAGPQSWVMWRPEFEVGFGGQRGGGKSFALMVWMIRGNFDLPQNHPCYATVLNHPKFSGLILRRDATDLEEFVESARPFYKALGGELSGKPATFKWKHGPYIRLTHLKSEEGFEKFRGNNIPRIGIEELTQLESMEAYMLLLSACRTPYPELRPAWSDALGQILSTFNPDGPGQAWVKDRFAEVESVRGIVPWGKTMFENIEGQRLTRIFVPAKLSDNPHLGASYRAGLIMQTAHDPALQAAWLEGVWGASSGTYFQNFRPTGPRTGEPPEANHVIPAKSVNLMPWWSRSIGVDWGLADEAVAIWGCYNQSDERIHIYRELVVNGLNKQILGTEELGAEIARLSLEDLEGLNDNAMTLYLAWDCFNRTDKGKTKAEQFAWGMQSVLGMGSVIVASAGGDLAKIQRYEELDGSARIVIRPSTRIRTDAWQYIRQLLRFTPLVELEREPNMEYARQLLAGEDGFLKYELYMQSFQKKQKAEVLPRILFHDSVPKLTKQLKDAVRDDKDPEDILETRSGGCHADRVNALRYLLWGMKETLEAMPKWAFMEKRLKDLPERIITDPTVYAQVAAKASRDYDKKHRAPSGLTLPRISVN